MSESYILPFIRNSVEEIPGPEQRPARQNGSLNFVSLYATAVPSFSPPSCYAIAQRIQSTTYPLNVQTDVV